MLNSCMSLMFKSPDTKALISLTDEIPGQRTGKVLRHVSYEIWTYHLLGLPSVPLGTREGIPADNLIEPLVKNDLAAGNGIVRLKVTHARTPLTWVATIFTLGLVSPTAVTVEGDVVELLPLSP